jgi:hypothetical protein
LCSKGFLAQRTEFTRKVEERLMTGSTPAMPRILAQAVVERLRLPEYIKNWSTGEGSLIAEYDHFRQAPLLDDSMNHQMDLALCTRRRSAWPHRLTRHWSALSLRQSSVLSNRV